MSQLTTDLESILFVASKPVTSKELAKVLNKNVQEVEEALDTLKMKFNTNDSGLWIFGDDGTVRMGTNPATLEKIEGFMKDEIAGELTRAQLETMTVIAYRGPITRPELEQIRGVNCSVIIRNLMIRGLVDEQETEQSLMPVYTLTTEALRHLGVSSVTELPEYASLHTHEHIDRAVGETTYE